MQITISGHNMQLTAPLKQYVNEKMERIERHFDHVTNTNVVLQVQKTRHLVEATINARGAIIHANAAADDMYAAIDAMADKLDIQVLKHKNKQVDHHRNGGALKAQQLK